MPAHGALLFTQFCWGSAAVINKLGLSGVGVSPLLFAFIREACAIPILFVLLYLGRARDNVASQSSLTSVTDSEAAEDVECADRETENKRCNYTLRLLPGFFIFVDQLCSLTGNMLADPVSAAAWQPSQVVITMVICMIVGMETLTRWKSLSILPTVCGALCLVFLRRPTVPEDHATHSRYYLGQIFFFVNCLASSLEVVLWRKLLQHSSASSEFVHFAVMAESYFVAAFLMAVACVTTSFIPDAVDFFCPTCGGNPWHVPAAAYIAIGYSVVFQTIIAYCCQAWALRYSPASLASLYATAQPVVAAFVTCSFLFVGFNPGGVLFWPGHEMIGAVLIILGIMIAQYGGGSGDGVCARRHR